jgi:hypothetical protein
MKNNFKNEIRKVLKETFLVNEMTVSEREPLYFEEFDLGGEFQYVFKTEKENIYYLSLKKTYVNIEDKEILSVLKSKKQNEVYFYAINFFIEGSNPNEENTFEEITNNEEFGTLLSNIVWLIKRFFENKGVENFIFSAEPRRMNLYSNVFNNFKSDFYIFGPDFFDKSYKYKQIIMIKK